MSAEAPRVLVVEDEPDTLEALCELLRYAGFRAVGCATAARALDELHRAPYSAVVADYGIDHQRDGWRVLAPIVTSAAPARVGLISAWRVLENDALAHGFAFYLPKPFDAEVLLARVAQIAGGRDPSDLEHERVVRYFQALAEHRWQALGELCDEDVVYQVPGSGHPYHRTVTGRAAFVAYAEETFARFPEARFEVRSVRRLPNDALIAEYAASWQGPDGAPGSLDGGVLFELRDERFARIGVRTDVQRLPKEPMDTAPPR